MERRGTQMPPGADQDDLDKINLSNQIALARARQLLRFFRLLVEREVQILKRSEKIPADSDVKKPQNSD